MKEEFCYRLKNKELFSFCHDILLKVKKEYPEIEIKFRTVCIKSDDDMDYIIASQKLEKLELPQKDLKRDLARILNDALIAIPYKQHNDEIGKVVSNFQISEEEIHSFESNLQMSNCHDDLFEPIGIETLYDEETKSGKIVSSKIPLEQLNSFFGKEFILDKDGNIGYSENLIGVLEDKLYLDENNNVRADVRYRLYLEDISKASLTKNITVDEISEPNYTKLIAAQNESRRRLKIASINRTIDTERNKKRISAILAGVFAAGVIVATKYSGVDLDQAIQTEFEAINSLEALKEYLSMITPAMYATIIGAVTNFCNYLRHKRNQKEAMQALNDMDNYAPTAFLDEVERQARNK